MMENYLKVLVNRIVECVDLSIPEDKATAVKNLLERHSKHLLLQVKDSENKDFIKAKFSNFINKSLSTIEALGLNDGQYKAVRKLVLAEINGCQEAVLKDLDKKLAATVVAEK